MLDEPGMAGLEGAREVMSISVWGESPPLLSPSIPLLHRSRFWLP